MGANNGTGCPLSFNCAKCRRNWHGGGMNDTRYRSTQVRTGRVRKAPGNKNARMLAEQHEYRCSCGHTGWSRHIDVLRLPLEP